MEPGRGEGDFLRGRGSGGRGGQRVLFEGERGWGAN